MTILLGTIAGAAVTALLVLAVRATWGAPELERENYRGHRLPTGAGVLLVVAVVGIEGVLALGSALDWNLPVETVLGRHLVLLGALGFGLLGLLDDLLGQGQSGGFRGHLTALARGRLTSGGVKLLGGGALALVIASLATPDPGLRLLADGALIALAANLGNLFDRAPGRCIKVSVLTFGVLLVGVGAKPELVGTAIVVGAGLGLLWADLRERLMLGDAGANVLGAALGIGAVLTATPTARTVVLVVVLALNLLSEVVSFSKVIDSTPPLRAFDRLGRLPVDRRRA